MTTTKAMRPCRGVPGPAAFIPSNHDDDETIPIGEWYPATCDEYEAAITDAGGLAALTVYRGYTGERYRHTEWGRPDQNLPVAAGTTGREPGMGCWHAIFISDPWRFDYEEAGL